MNNKPEIRFATEIVRANIEDGIKSALANAKDDEFEGHADDRQQIATLQAFLDAAIDTWQDYAEHNIHAETSILIEKLHEQLQKIRRSYE